MAYVLGESCPAAGYTVVCQVLAAYSIPFTKMQRSCNFAKDVGVEPAKIYHSWRSKAVFSISQACMGCLGPQLPFWLLGSPKRFLFVLQFVLPCSMALFPPKNVHAECGKDCKNCYKAYFISPYPKHVLKN